MPSSHLKTRRYFTEAAREAAARARREKGAARLAASEQSNLAVFVVRADEPENRFRWEVRRFGALAAVHLSEETYPTLVEALRHGETALALMNERGAGSRGRPTAVVVPDGNQNALA